MHTLAQYRKNSKLFLNGERSFTVMPFLLQFSWYLPMQILDSTPPFNFTAAQHIRVGLHSAKCRKYLALRPTDPPSAGRGRGHLYLRQRGKGPRRRTSQARNAREVSVIYQPSLVMASSTALMTMSISCSLTISGGTKRSTLPLVLLMRTLLSLKHRSTTGWPVG